MPILYYESKAHNEYLAHHGILGQKWGKRNGPPYPLQDKISSFNTININGSQKSSENKRIAIDNNGDKVIPKGFQFNRVGSQNIDINKAGALYVSYGDDDLQRYIKALGPSTLGKLMGTAATTIQHISVKKQMRMPSNENTAKLTAELLLKDKELLKSFNSSIYSIVVMNDFSANVSEDFISQSLKNPKSKDCQKISYAISSMLADPNYVQESKKVVNYFRKNGYDAIPDIHDVYSGTSNTACMIINLDNISLTSTKEISKDTFREAKKYIKSIEKLKVNDLIK